MDTQECLACKNFRGDINLSVAPKVFNGKYWFVEHVYPTSVRGWMCVVLKRHCPSMSELTHNEYRELSLILEVVTKAQREIYKTEKEYLMQFAEKEGFHHVHFHVVPKHPDLPEELKGTNIFAALGDQISNPLSDEDIIEAAMDIKSFFVLPEDKPPT